MKLWRFTPAGVDAVRELLPRIKTTADLALARELVLNDELTEQIPALAPIELDETRQFETTFAFCEYFHSLIKDFSPLTYRTDVGFWTWLAMVYIEQLAKTDSEKIELGDASRIVYVSIVFGKSHRHLLASAYYLFAMYDVNPELVRVPLWHPMNTPGDIFENIIARQGISQNPAFLNAIRLMYFDNSTGKVKEKVAGPGQAGGIRRFVNLVDQLGMTRDFSSENDAIEFIRILPSEFEVFKVGVI